MHSMKLQFSLATLLVCVTVLAVVCALAVALPVNERTISKTPGRSLAPDGLPVTYEMIHYRHKPTPWEVTARTALWGSPAIVLTLGLAWAIRRLKSRRENVPPVE